MHHQIKFSYVLRGASSAFPVIFPLEIQMVTFGG